MLATSQLPPGTSLTGGNALMDAIRTPLCDIGILKGSEFPRKVQRFARRRGICFQYEPSLGKGSHGRVWLATVSTTLKDPKKELGTGLFRAMCRDLGIEPRDL